MTASIDNLVYTQPNQCVSSLAPSSIYDFSVPELKYNYNKTEHVAMS